MLEKEELLDDTLVGANRTKQDPHSKNIILKSILYFAIMMAGGFLYFYFLPLPSITNWFGVALKDTLLSIVPCLFFSFILESVRYYKRKRSADQQLVDPFWFQIVEGGFGIWILLSAVMIILFLISL